MVAAAGALAPAGALATPAIACARLCRTRAIPAFMPYATAGAKAPAAATIAAAATWPDFSDGNLGPDSTDGNLGPDSANANLESDFSGWLACCALPWLGLAWACLACLALAWSSKNNRPPSAAAAAAAAAAAVAAAGCSDGNLGPNFSDANLEPDLSGWLACCALPWLGLAWACLACLALAWSSHLSLIHI